MNSKYNGTIVLKSFSMKIRVYTFNTSKDSSYVSRHFQTFKIKIKTMCT